MDESKSDARFSKTDFDTKKEYFNETWENVVTSMEGCIKMLDDDYDKEWEIPEFNHHLELLKTRLRQFFDLEVELEKKIASDVEIKNIGESDVDPSEKERELKCDDLISSVPADSVV